MKTPNKIKHKGQVYVKADRFNPSVTELKERLEMTIDGFQSDINNLRSDAAKLEDMLKTKDHRRLINYLGSFKNRLNSLSQDVTAAQSLASELDKLQGIKKL